MLLMYNNIIIFCLGQSNKTGVCFCSKVYYIKREDVSAKLYILGIECNPQKLIMSSFKDSKLTCYVNLFWLQLE